MTEKTKKPILLDEEEKSPEKEPEKKGLEVGVVRPYEKLRKNRYGIKRK